MTTYRFELIGGPNNGFQDSTPMLTKRICTPEGTYERATLASAEPKEPVAYHWVEVQEQRP